MDRQKETRAFHSDAIELRNMDEAQTSGEQKYVDGFGVVYDREEQLWDGYYEKIDRAAFKECLAKNPEVKSFFNHDPNYVLSTTASDPALQIQDLGDGLWFSSPIPDTTYGRDLVENLSRGNVKGASFTFTVDKDVVTTDREGNYHRTIMAATIYEIGPVTNPAYVQTQVSLRDKDALMQDAQTRTAADNDIMPFAAYVEALREMHERDNEYRRNLISLLEITN